MEILHNGPKIAASASNRVRFLEVHISATRWPADIPLAGAPGFYRFRQSLPPALNQSARLSTIHRILPDLVSGQRGLPERLQPAWLGDGAVRPWSSGAAGPRVADRPGLRRRHRRGAWPRRDRRERDRCRGIRAGRRVQLRRQTRQGCESIYRHKLPDP